MKKSCCALALCVLLGVEAVYGAAAGSSGSEALALAALVAVHSPSLSVNHKHVMEELFSGNRNITFPAAQKITIKADKIECRRSDVDLTQRSCELTFGTHKRTIKGRAANEMDATMAQAGVASEGAAGTIYESLTQLVCTVDPNEIKSADGGGADCTYMTGP
jgi:hypothetical protein